jgi:hypothetical protein
MIETLRSIYREYGWPDLNIYCKEECMKAVREVMKERFPGFSDEG